MAAADMADRVGHGQDRQPECERDPKQPYSDLGKGCGEHGAAAPSEDKPKCAKKLGGCSAKLRHEALLDYCF
ncbi:hypothetical protein SAE02_74900 [Skermanella aerolata]|uniref:Uncharacterized protein n=1 Tax=Skermanella aerolata TaxID=393310 RepID=A0A512E3N3_9PROT|nr:hypothetical protein SAE02_74900 [Skermanella aerolata]